MTSPDNTKVHGVECGLCLHRAPIVVKTDLNICGEEELCGCGKRLGFHYRKEGYTELSDYIGLCFYGTYENYKKFEAARTKLQEIDTPAIVAEALNRTLGRVPLWVSLSIIALCIAFHVWLWDILI